MSKVITDQKLAAALLEWMAEEFKVQLGNEWMPPTDARTIAFINPEPDNIARKQDVIAVCALSRWTTHTCEATLATSEIQHLKANREFIWTIFDYVFNHAGKSRMYTFVHVKNLKSIAVQKKLGMSQDAVLADHFGEGEDAVLFGITKKQWLSGRWGSRAGS
jgi:RimJ/RimL family protein N-acetyltransferase